MTIYKHTPGPWTAQPVVDEEDELRVLSADGSYVCSIDLDGTFEDDILAQIYADADMIAAAPELLDALKGMVRYAEYAQLWNKTPNDEYHKAVEVIAKAEGKL